MREKSKKIKSERYLQSTIKVGVMIIFILFFMSFISAEDWFKFDNVKQYDAVTKTVSVVDVFGIGKTIADIKLTTPSNVELPLGYFNFANITLTSYGDYTDVLSLIDFYDKNINPTVFDDKNQINRKFDVLVREIEEYSVDDYKLVPNLNGTGNMWIVSGNHSEYRTIWKPLDNPNISLKEATPLNVELWTTVENGDNIEWIPTFMKKIRVTEWGSFNASGGTVTWDGIYQVNTFTANGTFTVTGDGTIQILMIGGGGAGGGATENMGAGGGAGGWLNTTAYSVTTGAYSVIVGAGGIGVVNNAGGNGQNTTFDTLIAYGGGGGGAGSGGGSLNGVNGGSGGGAGRNGAHGNPIQPNYGAATGYGKEGGNSSTNGLAGGGGAGVAGKSSTASAQGGNGGNGLTSTIYNGTALWYAGGGGGSGNTGTGTGGLGGGGHGGAYDNEAGGTAGAANTGGGGGGNGKAGAFAGFNGGSGIVIIRFLSTLPIPTVTLDAPSNYSNLTNPTILFNTTVIDEEYVENVSLYVDGVLLETSLNHTNGTYSFTQTLTNGKHNWSILAYNNNSNPNVANIAELWVDNINPSLILSSPENKSYKIGTFSTTNNYSVYMNWSANDTGLNSCWYSTNANATNYTITCSINSTLIYSTIGTHTLDFYVNDNAGNVNHSAVTFSIAANNYSLGNLTQDVYVTQNTSYWINTTANTSLTSANLYLNGTTRYTGVLTGDTWNVSLDIPKTQVGNTSFIWELTYMGVASNTTTVYTNIKNITWVLCDGTYNVKYLNISFRDESNDSLIKADVPASTWNYYLGTGSVYETYSYSTATFFDNYTYCFSPSNQSVKVDYVFQYSGITYPQRTYNPTELTFNNTDINKTLYLLSNVDGIYVTFQVINTAEQPIEGVYVNASREIGGTITMVGEGTTGADGGVTFWLNPDFTHTFYFVKTGYTTYVASFQPTQSLYTVSLGTTSSTTNYDYTKAVDILVTPTGNSLYNNTIYSFSVNLTSTYWEVSKFGFEIQNGSGTSLATTSALTNGGNISTSLDTSGNTSLIMYFYYLANGTYTNYTYYWTVLSSEGTDWSLKNFATDLKSYSDAGMFGLSTGSFAFGILIFLIIMVSVGIMSYKFGLTSPATISGSIFAIVFLLDVGLGLMDTLNPVGAISHFPTIFVLIVTIALAIREGTR